MHSKDRKAEERAAKAVADAIASSVRERMLRKVAERASAFESRWTMNALLREAPDLHEALEEQIGMFHESLVSGDDEDIAAQGAATCRGWQQATIIMEKSGIANDAIHIGTFGDVVVAIGRAQRAPDWLREEHGAGLAWLTPRECAAMYFQIREVQAVKAEWLDAEIVEIRERATCRCWISQDGNERDASQCDVHILKPATTEKGDAVSAGDGEGGGGR